MRLLFVVDGRSPIALDWIEHFVDRGEEVHMVSTFWNEQSSNFASLHFLPVAFSSLKTGRGGENGGKSSSGSSWSVPSIRFRTALRRWLAPLTLPKAALRLRQLVDEIKPDLVHAMRIPFEGMVAASALAQKRGCPLVVSVWGNDFTLHASSTPWMARFTRDTLSRADGLHTDCQRDAHLARVWGYSDGKQTLVVPGNGGVRTDLFYPPEESSLDRRLTVINPRGFRAYVRNDTFFRALPPVLKSWPQTKILCPGMAGERQAIRWVEQLDLGMNVELLPKLSRKAMADVFRLAGISISPTTHDGTPNTLLEAMACGCFPIAGNLESVREWITPDVNGQLFDPSNPQMLSQTILRAIDEPELILSAANRNQRIIGERAERSRIMNLAEEFYLKMRPHSAAERDG
jgi:glycosyltransferase involved in cell wall biosynthesis